MNKREPRNAACFDSDGIFVGVESDYGQDAPNNSTYTIPEDRPGYAAKWSGKEWTYIEDHRGERGFVDGKPIEPIKELGPLPDGFTTEYVDPRTPEEIRRQEILGRLGEIDSLSVRPLRAIRRGKAKPEDETRLDNLEAEAETLREELSTLS